MKQDVWGSEQNSDVRPKQLTTSLSSPTFHEFHKGCGRRRPQGLKANGAFGRALLHKCRGLSPLIHVLRCFRRLSLTHKLKYKRTNYNKHFEGHQPRPKHVINRRKTRTLIANASPGQCVPRAVPTSRWIRGSSFRPAIGSKYGSNHYG